MAQRPTAMAHRPTAITRPMVPNEPRLVVQNKMMPMAQRSMAMAQQPMAMPRPMAPHKPRSPIAMEH